MNNLTSSCNYLSITDILVTNERVPSKFLHDLPKMGFLDPSSTEDDLKAGITLDLPYWLAESLCFRRPPLLSIELPKVYKEAYREILKADSCAIDLHKLGLYFYELGCYISKFDIKSDVADTLVNTFRQRFRMLLDSCVCDGMSAVSQKLASGERDRASNAAVAVKALDSWLHKGGRALETAQMVASHRKRKRDEMEML